MYIKYIYVYISSQSFYNSIKYVNRVETLWIIRIYYLYFLACSLLRISYTGYHTFCHHLHFFKQLLLICIRMLLGTCCYFHNSFENVYFTNFLKLTFIFPYVAFHLSSFVVISENVYIALPS